MKNYEKIYKNLEFLEVKAEVKEMCSAAMEDYEREKEEDGKEI